MIARRSLTSNLDTTSATFVVVPGTQIAFYVEEPEMLVDMEFDAAVSHSDAGGIVDLSFEVDGVVVGGANGLSRMTIAAAAAVNSVCVRRTGIRLSQGLHRMSVQFKTPAFVGTGARVAGATINSEVVVVRNSHPAALGHGVESKVQLVQ